MSFDDGGNSNYLETIDTSCSEDVIISLGGISHTGSLEENGNGRDSLQVYYTIDDGGEVLGLEIVGDQYSITEEIIVASSGDLLTIRVTGKTTHSSESYQISTLEVVEKPTECAVPSFGGSWIEGNPAYPLNVAESQGGMIGNDLLVVSGFSGDWGVVTKKVFKLDTTNPNADWEEQDEVLYPTGVSHTGFVINGQKFYICGGYIGRKNLP